MKKILISLVMAMLLPAILAAQSSPCPVGNWRTSDVCLNANVPIDPTTTSVTFNLPDGVMMYSNAISYSPRGSMSGVTITVSGNAGSGFSTITTSTVTTATTLTFNGTYRQIKVTESGGTAGAAAIDVNYVGSSAVSGAFVVVTPNPLYPTAYNSGITTIASGSTTSVTTTATMIQSMYLNNYTASSVNVNVMDNSGNYILGPDFALPARSNITYQLGPGLVYSGVTASASAASSVKINVGGRQ